MKISIRKIEFLRKRVTDPDTLVDSIVEDGGIMDYEVLTDEGRLITTASVRFFADDWTILTDLKGVAMDHSGRAIQAARTEMEAKQARRKKQLLEDQQRLVDAGLKRSDDPDFLK
jgi:hypothetical protein